MRTLRAALTVAALGAGFASPPMVSAADVHVFHGAQSGRQTLDEGEGGGNPFASALIEILGRTGVSLAQLPDLVTTLTRDKSGGFQLPDVPHQIGSSDIPLVPKPAGEQRLALVLVVSDYRLAEGAPSLPGARRDAQRIAAALQRAGFATQLALDQPLTSMRATLDDFRRRSATVDTALIYTTGHGVEVGGTVFLLPGDYPVTQRQVALQRRALSLPEIARAPAARRANLVFYAGCRDNPFGP